ncbi:hypothetical protein J4456_00020 [Candidatus Pacearchaeota archaeon]|nr:hypothetical protein [Candidatus Pacearchaeota archaeon]
MKKICILFLLVSTLLLATVFANSYYYERYDTDRESRDTQWVSIMPKQCNNPWESSNGNENSQLRNYLEKKDIRAYSIVKIKKDIITCSACNCPRGDTIYILIDEDDFKKINKLGFMKSASPNYSIEKERNNFNRNFNHKFRSRFETEFFKKYFPTRTPINKMHEFTMCYEFYDGIKMQNRCIKLP